MEPTTVDNNEIQIKIKQIYYLAAILIACTSMQWLLLNNFDFFDFLLNSWLLAAAFTTCIVIIVILTLRVYAETNMPKPLTWAMAIAFVETIVIVFSSNIKTAGHYSVIVSLFIIISSMVIFLSLGQKFDEQHLPIFSIITFFCNLLLIFLVFTVIIATKFFADIFKIIFFIVFAVAVPLLFLNLVYTSMLIAYNRYEPENLTDCLKPALYIYATFFILVWFSLELNVLTK